MKHVRCKFHFSDGGCRAGDQCIFSHSKKTPEGGRGRYRSLSPSPSSSPPNKPCFQFKKDGTCSRANCPFKHVSVASPAEGSGGGAKSPRARPRPTQRRRRRLSLRLQPYDFVALGILLLLLYENGFHRMSMRSLMIHRWTATLTLIARRMMRRIARLCRLILPSLTKGDKSDSPKTFDFNPPNRESPRKTEVKRSSE